MFSSLAAGGITYLVKNGRESASAALTSDTSWREPYRLLNSFWQLPVPEKSIPLSAPPGGATRLLSEIGRLDQAESALDQGNPTAAANILQPIDSRYPFVNRKKNELWLNYLYITKQYRQYIEFSGEKRLQGGELLLLTIDALVQSKRLNDAFRLFKGNFQEKKLAFFQPAMPAPLLRSFLQRLDTDFWQSKFSWLLSRNEYREFLLESRYARSPQLIRIFRADFNYRNKRYEEARKLLAGISQTELLAHRDKLLLKIDLRSDKVSDLRSRVARFRDQGGLYNEILFDTASILLLREDYQESLFHFAEFLRASTQKDADYWKAVWIMAWIHYRNGQQRMALKLFDRGSQANLLDYRLACQFWKFRLSGQPSPDLFAYPFSYYSIRSRGEESWRQRLPPGRFLFLISGPLSPLLRELIDDLRILAANGQFDSCFSLIRWGKQCPELTRVDINLLKILESILYAKQNRYDLAFDRFRANFKSYPMVRLPDFLSPLFFPTRYVDLIKKYSRLHGVDPLLVLALIRDESFFRADAVSPAGACGLMQLVFETAAREARGSNTRLKRSQLFEAETNIRFGVQHLKTLLDKYQNRIHLVLAAYNAGDTVVDEWLNKFGTVADDIFIELIPYTESRNYVKNILRNYFYYRYYHQRWI